MTGMSIPVSDNPYSVSIQPAPTQGMGIHSEKEGPYSASNLYGSMQKSVSGLQKKVNQWQLEVDKTLAQDLINDLLEEQLRQKNDPNDGWVNQKGKNALERPDGKSLAEEASERLKESYDSIRKRAGSPRVQKLFDNYYRNADAALINDVNTHVNNQFQVYRSDTQQRSLQNAISLGMSDNPNDRKSGIAAARAIIDEIYKDKGLEADYSKGPGLIHSMSLEKMINLGQLGQAKAYLKEYGHEMNEQQKAAIKKLMDVANKEASLDAQAKKLIDQLGEDPAQNLRILREAAQLPGEDGRKIEWRVQKEVSRIQRIREIDNKEREAAAWNLINNGVEPPLSEMEKMKTADPAAYKRIQTYRQKGQATQTDPEKYAELERMAIARPDDFANTDLSTWKAYLSPEDLRSLERQQKNMTNEQFKQFMKLVEAGAKSQLIKNGEKLRMLKASATALFDQEARVRKNGVFSHSELETLTQSLFKGEEEELGWNSKYPLYQQMQKPISDWISGIDNDDLAQIIVRDFPDSVSRGFSKDVLKNSSKARRIADHYALRRSFPRDIVAQVRIELEGEMKKAGINRPITQSMVYRAIAEKYFRK